MTRDAAKRLLIAHALAYPVALVHGAGFVPIALRVMPQLFGLSPEDARRAVAEKIAAPVLAVLLLATLAGLPWVLGRDVAKGRRTFASLWALLFAMGAFGAGAAWFLLYYR